MRFMRSGHDRLIKTEHQSDYETTIHASYPNPHSTKTCVLTETIGNKKRLTEGSLYDMVAAEIRAEAEERARPPPINYNSTTTSDFFKEVKGMIQIAPWRNERKIIIFVLALLGSEEGSEPVSSKNCVHNH